MYTENESSNILVIGNGIAGLSAAEAARKTNDSISITLITEENYLTYYRTRLCDIFSNSFEIQKLFLYKNDWYKEKRLDIILNNKITGIDITDKYVLKSEGKKIYFDKLIIAAGSHSYIPSIEGIDKKGVFGLRNINDAVKINESDCSNGEVIVVGGGLLGLEAAYRLSNRNKRVTIVEFFPRLFPNQLDEKGSYIFENKVRSLGINIVNGASLSAIKGNNSVEEALFSNGLALKAGLIIFTAGVRPNIGIVNGTGINTNKGIIVDDYMKTNFDYVYAAGDIAEYGGRMSGLWTAAMNQGKTAGINAAGGNIRYIPEAKAYFLNTMDTKVYSIGDIGNNRDTEYKTLEMCDELRFIYKKVYFKDNLACGAVLIGDVSNMSKISSIVKEKAHMNDVEL